MFSQLPSRTPAARACPFRLKGLVPTPVVLRLSITSVIRLRTSSTNRPCRRCVIRCHIGPLVHSISDARPRCARTRRRSGLPGQDIPCGGRSSLIHTDHRMGRIVRPGIHFQHVLHAHTKAAFCCGGIHHISCRHGLSLFFLTPCAPSRAISSALPAAVSTHRTAYAASTASARPARRYRRSRPTAPRLRHPAPLPARGSACGVPT